VSVIALTASHHDVDLALLDRLSAGADQLGLAAVRHGGPLRGAVTVATCNRFELYADLAVESDSDDGPALDHASHALIRLIADLSQTDPATAAQALTLNTGRAVANHLFTVASGLDSMALGEREIAGQVKRALAQARDQGTTSKELERLFQAAARTAKQVAAETPVSAAGRSLVDIGLDLAATPDPRPAAGGDQTAWSTRQVLLLGTGAYAGATVAALRRRGVSAITVYSPSGRAEAFAHSHAVTAVPGGAAELAAAVAAADLVVAVSGHGDEPVITADLISRRPGDHPLVLLDLALPHDIDPAAGQAPGVRLIDLAELQRHLPAADRAALAQAHALVEKAVAEFATEQAARRADGAVAQLTQEAQRQISAEVAYRLLGSWAGGPAPQVEDAEVESLTRAVRRRVNADLHQRITALRRELLAEPPDGTGQ